MPTTPTTNHFRLSAALLLLSCLALLVCACLLACAKSSPNAQVESASPTSSRAANAMPTALAMERFNDPLLPPMNTEAYDSVEENAFFNALTQPQSTFSIDVDTASYSNVRRMLNDGISPPSGAVRLEELVNYFRFDYPEPDGQHPLSVSTEIAVCPWDTAHQLLRIGLRGKSIQFAERRKCNLVFLLDVSGSMLSDRKLPLVKSAMKMLTEELHAEDRIAIVVYAGASGLALESTPISKSDEILAAIENLNAGGSTDGGAGIQLAYRVAEQNFVSDGINRVILCTDGDFNVGTTNQSDLVELIRNKAKSNVFLTVLGFGSGNLKDSTMEKLADNGNGNYAYIDSLLEARKVLVEEVGATLVTIAKDVKIQVDFNPQHVQAYRLLGYENRLLENQDFRNDAKDAGEIGSGHTVTAFYELIPADAPQMTVAARPSEFVNPALSDKADTTTQLTVNLRYKRPNASESEEFQVRVPAGMDGQQPSADFQFASSVLAYGMLLRKSKSIEHLSWDWVIDTASANLGTDERGLRGEFLQLAKAARRLSR